MNPFVWTLSLLLVLSLGCAAQPHHTVKASVTAGKEAPMPLPCPVRLVGIVDSRKAGVAAGYGISLDDLAPALQNGLSSFGVTMGDGPPSALSRRLSLEIVSASLSQNTGMRSFNLVLRASLDGQEPWIVRGSSLNVPWTESQEGYHAVIQSGIENALAKLQADLTSSCL